MFTVPNALTFARLLLVPVFVWLYVAGNAAGALTVFIAASVTDGLDGLLARALHQETRLGGFLDPAADKLLALAAMVLLVAAHLLPGWLLALVVFRDAGIVFGSLLLASQGLPMHATPSRIGKYSTFVLGGAIVLALTEGVVYDGRSLAPYVVALSLLAAECVAVSTAQYFTQWLHLLRRRPA